jgi:hypothetical protein
MTKKTKWIRYRATAVNPRKVFSLAGYTFRYDANLKAIPVEVPEEDAKMLLEMMDRPCNCHYREAQHLFEEVQLK